MVRLLLRQLYKIGYLSRHWIGSGKGGIIEVHLESEVLSLYE